MVAQPRKKSAAKRFIWRASLLLILVGLVITVRLVEKIGPDWFGDERFMVVKATDGDTIELMGGDRVRLLAIDAPEKGQPLYDRACRMLDRLTVGKIVKLEFSGRRRDKYGRLLGFVIVDDSLMVNRVMLERGLANLYLFKDTNNDSDKIRMLLSAQREAMKNERGIWALEHEPEYYYVNLPGSFRFHRPACQSVSRSATREHIRYEIREQAMALGLSPCRNCKP